MRKECTLSLDRSSARTLWVPGRCTAANLKLPCVSVKKMQRSRCIMCLFLLYLPLRTATTAELSHCANTCLPCQRCPHTTAAITLGSSSLAAMFHSRVAKPHSSWNQWVLYHAPQPQEPEASEVRWRECSSGILMIAAPFQWSANAFHHFMSLFTNERRRQSEGEHER